MIGLTLALLLAAAEPSKDDLAKTCLAAVAAKDFSNAANVCLNAYDRPAEQRVWRHLSTAADAAVELRNAQMMEGLAISRAGLGQLPLARSWYGFAFIEAEDVNKSTWADDSQKGIAKAVIDRYDAWKKGPGAGLDSVMNPWATTGCDEVATVQTQEQPDYPESARKLKLGPLFVLVEVKIDADGKIATANVYRSSGNADVDAAALQNVRAATFSPQRVHCQNVPSTPLLYRVKFSPD